jgi:hypothetical protein
MEFAAVRQFLNRIRGASGEDEAAPSPETALTPVVSHGPSRPDVWPALALRHRLCGEGFSFPDGEAEVLHLARPLGLTEAASVALLGAGSGGPVAAITAAFGAWVSGYEADPALIPIALAHCRHTGQAKRASISLWRPDAPDLPHRHFHHALSLYALAGAPPRGILAALTGALHPGGQLVLLDFAAPPKRGTDPAIAAWAQREDRPPVLPCADDITALLANFGWDVRVVEDLSDRHVATILRAWHTLVRPMAQVRPSLTEAKLLVSEAERWLHRVRLLQSGQLRLVRWHAIAGDRAPPLA